MTDLELLKQCTMNLGEIQIPAYLTDKIAVPINNVRNSLIVLINTIEKQMKEEKPEVEVVPVDMAQDNSEN